MISDTPEVSSYLKEEYEHKIRSYADVMRDKPTNEEATLCEMLTENNIKYNFQEVIDNRYIADFCLLDYKLIIEVDGNSHSGKKARGYDRIRNKFTKKRKYKTLRIKNNYLKTHKYLVMPVIEEAIKRLSDMRFNENMKDTAQGWMFQPDRPPNQERHKNKPFKRHKRKKKRNKKYKFSWMNVDNMTLAQLILNGHKDIAIKRMRDKKQREERLLNVSRSKALSDMEHLSK